MTAAVEQRVAWRELWQGGRLPLVIVLCLGVWLHAAESLLVATLIPAAVAAIGGIHLVAWTIALYLLGSIVAGAVAGLASLRFGLRRAFVFSALLYAAGCVVSALAPDMPTMLAGRVPQGLGGGGMLALSFVGVERLFDKRLMPRLIALISAVWGASAFLGPLVGGVFAEIGLWRYGFWAFAGQAMVLAPAVWLILPPDRIGAAVAGRAPWGRLAIFATGALAIAAAGIEVSALGSPLLIAAGVALLAGFFAADARAGDDRLFPHGVLSLSGPVGAGCLMVALFAMGTVAYTVYGPLLGKLMHGASPLTVGYLVALESIGWSVAAVAVSGVRAEVATIRIGATLLTLSTLAFAVAVPFGSLLAVVPALLLAGGGFGAAYAFVLARVTAGAGAADKARAAAALPTMQLIGYTVAAAGLGIVANAAGLDQATPEAAQRTATWVFAASIPPALLGLVAAWRLTMKRGGASIAA
ncbi:MAG: MFS transporter [Alphaproteobacteria bacterium]